MFKDGTWPGCFSPPGNEKQGCRRGRQSRSRLASAWTQLLLLMLLTLLYLPVSQAAPGGKAQINSTDKSDLNGDLVIDELDLELFGSRYLPADLADFDWCGFHDATVAGVIFAGPLKRSQTIKDKPAAYYNKHYGQLLGFMNDYHACEAIPLPESLALENFPRLLLRMTMSKDGSGDIYITDPFVNSVFFYDEGLLPRAELKGLSRPLGVAVDIQGRLLVGNDFRNNVEAYDLLSGELVAVFGEDLVIMPNSISVGPDGNIFVTDSRHHRVLVYDAGYNFLRAIGSPGTALDELDFPVDTQVIRRWVDGQPETEVFVADQGNERIQIYDIYGRFLRQILPGKCGMSGCLPPRLANLQALDVDSLGRLHVLDNFEAVVSILDPASGDFLGEYGEYGEGPGFLRVPFGLVIKDSGHPVVTSGEADRLEIYPPQ